MNYIRRLWHDYNTALLSNQVKKRREKLCAFHYYAILQHVLGSLFGLTAVAGIDEALDSIDKKQNGHLKETEGADEGKGPPGHIENVGSAAVLNESEGLQNTAIAESGGNKSLNEENNAEPYCAELFGHHINKHGDPNMTLLGLHSGNCKHCDNDKEVRGKLITALYGNGLTADFAEDNVNCNDEYHHKAHSHAYIANAIDDFTDCVAYLFQDKFPLSERITDFA